MILTGKEIALQRALGNLHISPWNEDNLGANSYDVTLRPQLLTYQLDLLAGEPLDPRRNNPTEEHTIPEQGFVLQPGTLYLAATVETAVSKAFVPMLEGRSSIGRLGICTHVTAGFGDIGWGYRQRDTHGVPADQLSEHWGLECTYPTWTLEMTCIHRVRIYAGMKIAQVYFMRPMGDITYYKGRYNDQKGPTASRLHTDK
jgi:dCTP deaminase